MSCLHSFIVQAHFTVLRDQAGQLQMFLNCPYLSIRYMESSVSIEYWRHDGSLRIPTGMIELSISKMVSSSVITMTHITPKISSTTTVTHASPDLLFLLRSSVREHVLARLGKLQGQLCKQNGVLSALIEESSPALLLSLALHATVIHLVIHINEGSGRLLITAPTLTSAFALPTSALENAFFDEHLLPSALIEFRRQFVFMLVLRTAANFGLKAVRHILSSEVTKASEAGSRKSQDEDQFAYHIPLPNMSAFFLELKVTCDAQDSWSLVESVPAISGLGCCFAPSVGLRNAAGMMFSGAHCSVIFQVLIQAAVLQAARLVTSRQTELAGLSCIPNMDTDEYRASGGALVSIFRLPAVLSSDLHVLLDSCKIFYVAGACMATLKFQATAINYFTSSLTATGRSSLISRLRKTPQLLVWDSTAHTICLECGPLVACVKSLLDQWFSLCSMVVLQQQPPILPPSSFFFRYTSSNVVSRVYAYGIEDISRFGLTIFFAGGKYKIKLLAFDNKPNPHMKCVHYLESCLNRRGCVEDLVRCLSSSLGGMKIISDELVGLHRSYNVRPNCYVNDDCLGIGANQGIGGLVIVLHISSPRISRENFGVNIEVFLLPNERVEIVKATFFTGEPVSQVSSLLAALCKNTGEAFSAGPPLQFGLRTLLALLHPTFEMQLTSPIDLFLCKLYFLSLHAAVLKPKCLPGLGDEYSCTFNQLIYRCVFKVLVTEGYTIQIEPKPGSLFTPALCEVLLTYSNPPVPGTLTPLSQVL